MILKKPEIVFEMEERVPHLLRIFQELINEETQEKLVENNRQLFESCVPADVSLLVDKLISLKIPMDEIKLGIDKLMVILHPTFENIPYSPPPQETYLGCLLENNRVLEEKLNTLQPLLKQLNESSEDKGIRAELINAIKDLNKYRNYYEIKERILFPEIRRHISKHGCLSIMSSYHNEIKAKLELALELLSFTSFNLDEFNKVTNELLLIMYEVKFREERILYIIVQNSISESTLDSLYNDSLEIGFPYFQPKVENKQDLN